MPPWFDWIQRRRSRATITWVPGSAHRHRVGPAFTAAYGFTIQAQNFRVLERLEWSPTGFCLLSGANGTGKSTVLDALRFLRTLFERGQEAAFLKVDARYFRNVDVPESEPVVFELRVDDLVWKLRFPMAAAGIKDTFGEELHRAGQLVLRADMFGQGWQLGEERLALDQVRCCAKVLWDRGDATWMKPLVDVVTGIRVYESYELGKVKRSESVELGRYSLRTDGANLWSILARASPAHSRTRCKATSSPARPCSIAPRPPSRPPAAISPIA